MSKQYKHRNVIIEDTPSEKLPNMVTILKAPKLRSYFVERRYITLENKRHPLPPSGGEVSCN